MNAIEANEYWKQQNALHETSDREVYNRVIDHIKKEIAKNRKRSTIYMEASISEQVICWLEGAGYYVENRGSESIAKYFISWYKEFV